MKYSYVGRSEVSSRTYSISGAHQIAPVHISVPLSKIRFDIVLPFYSQQALPSGLSNQNPV
jgi:hypothetical protein